MRLIGPGGALPADVERPLLALATHPRIAASAVRRAQARLPHVFPAAPAWRAESGASGRGSEADVGQPLVRGGERLLRAAGWRSAWRRSSSTPAERVLCGRRPPTRDDGRRRRARRAPGRRRRAGAGRDPRPPCRGTASRRTRRRRANAARSTSIAAPDTQATSWRSSVAVPVAVPAAQRDLRSQPMQPPVVVGLWSTRRRSPASGRPP